MVSRDPKSKLISFVLKFLIEILSHIQDHYYMPHKNYANTGFPHFIQGGAVFLSRNITTSILKAIYSYTGDVLDLDDVFITGIIAEKLGIPRYEERVQYVGESCAGDVCQLLDTFVVFQCLDEKDIQVFWDEWKTVSREECLKRRVTTTSTLKPTKPDIPIGGGQNPNLKPTLKSNPKPNPKPTTTSKTSSESSQKTSTQGSTAMTTTALTTTVLSLLLLLSFHFYYYCFHF